MTKEQTSEQDTVEQKMETIMQQYNKKEYKISGIDGRLAHIERRLNGLAACFRKHFGDEFKEGFGMVKTLAAIAVVFGGIVLAIWAATPRLWDIGPSSSGYVTNGVGVCYVSWDGTNCVFHVDQIVAGGVTNLASAMTGNLPTATMTNHVGAAIVAAPVFNVPTADITNSVGTAGSTYTNAQSGWTNVFSAYGILISHTP